MSFPDTIVLFVLALLLFGPKKLPGIARQVGKALNEFKRASNEFKAQIESEINQLDIQEQQKEREKEQQSLVQKTNENVLPPAEPPAGAVFSSRYSGHPEATVESVRLESDGHDSGPHEPTTSSQDVSLPTHNPTNA
jgi:TatA/E family protein of Tat protein translocase